MKSVHSALIAILVFAMVFFVLQRLTFMLRFPPYERTTIWAPGALTFSALLLLPNRQWWTICFGVSLGAGAAYWGDQSIPSGIALVAAQFHFAAVALSVWWMRRFGGESLFGNVTSLIVFFIAAGIIAPLATTGPIDLLRWLNGTDDVVPVAVRSFLCCSLGMLIATPAFFKTMSEYREWYDAANQRRLMELGLLVVSLLVVGQWTFGQPASSETQPAMLYAPIPILLWAAMRWRLAGTSLALLLVAYLSTWNAIHERGPFIVSNSAANVLQIQLFLLAMSLPLMFLAVVVRERQHAVLSLVHASRLTMLSEFTTSIAHEINQPLGAILSNTDAAEMLLETANPPLEEVRQILADIRNDDLRASKIIKNLRKLLRRGKLELQPVDINSVIGGVISIVRGETRRRNVDLQTDLAPQLPLVLGDLVHLQQVLLNIVANGMDAMSETAGNKQLTISTTNGDGVVHVSVADRGPGIPKDLLPQLFDRFFTTKKDGMGMGLSICKSLIEGLGGRIWAESVPGHGATFHFSLPVASVAARVRSAPESHLSPESHS